MQRLGVVVQHPLAPAVIGRGRVAQQRDQEDLLQPRTARRRPGQAGWPRRGRCPRRRAACLGCRWRSGRPPRSCSPRSRVGCRSPLAGAAADTPPSRCSGGRFSPGLGPKGPRLTVRRAGYRSGPCGLGSCSVRGGVGASWLIGALEALEAETGWRAPDAEQIVGTSAGCGHRGAGRRGVPPEYMGAYAPAEARRRRRGRGARRAAAPATSAPSAGDVPPAARACRRSAPARGAWRCRRSCTRTATRPPRCSPAGCRAASSPPRRSVTSSSTFVPATGPTTRASGPSPPTTATGRRVAFGRDDAPRATVGRGGRRVVRDPRLLPPGQDRRAPLRRRRDLLGLEPRPPVRRGPRPRHLPEPDVVARPGRRRLAGRPDRGADARRRRPAPRPRGPQAARGGHATS